jgi:hypothetical protein
VMEKGTTAGESDGDGRGTTAGGRVKCIISEKVCKTFIILIQPTAQFPTL